MTSATHPPAGVTELVEATIPHAAQDLSHRFDTLDSPSHLACIRQTGFHVAAKVEILNGS
jgi:hypothetical protein